MRLDRLSALRKRCRERRGSAMVEFALVAPLLILILVGIMVLGLVINAKIVVSGAAREAGRTWAVYKDDGMARSKAADSLSGGGLKFSEGGAVLFEANQDVQFQREGNYVKADVTYRQPMLAPLIAELMGASDGRGHLVLHSQATFRVER